MLWYITQGPFFTCYPLQSVFSLHPSPSTLQSITSTQSPWCRKQTGIDQKSKLLWIHFRWEELNFIVTHFLHLSWTKDFRKYIAIPLLSKSSLRSHAVLLGPGRDNQAGCASMTLGHDVALKNKCIVSASSPPRGKHCGCKQDQETICVAGDLHLQITPMKRWAHVLPSTSCRVLTERWDLWHVVE